MFNERERKLRAVARFLEGLLLLILLGVVIVCYSTMFDYLTSNLFQPITDAFNSFTNSINTTKLGGN